MGGDVTRKSTSEARALVLAAVGADSRVVGVV